ncbi:MAG: hypothetical protein ABI002_01445, partial [Saprospiraceae bacterium]
MASAQTQPDCPDESIAEFAETLENDGPDGCTQCQGCEFPENMTWDEIMSGNGELTESSEIFGPLTVEDIKNDNGDNPEDPEGDIEIQQDNLIGLLNTINQQVDLKKMVDCININCLTDLTYFNYINLDSLNDILIADGQNAVTEEDLDNIQETLGYLNMDSLAMVAFCGPIGFDDCTYQGPCGTIQTKPSSRGGENDYDKAELDLFSHQIIGIEKAGTVPNLPNASYSDAFHDAEIDVDLYNGIPTVRFPLITFTSKDISFDLSAINHGKGVIVNEYGGVLGQSWDLSGIPTITRTIKGFPDESIITSTGYGMGPSPTLKLCTKVAGMCFTLAKPAKIFRYSWKEPTKLHIHVFIAAIPNSTGVNVYLSLDFVIELNVRFKPSHIDYEEKIVGFQELTNAGVMSSEFGTSNPTIGDVQNLTYPEKAKYGYKAAGTKNIEDFQFLVPKAGLIVNFLKGGANLFTNPLERRKKMDTEADEFSYNLGNYSGKFVIEQDGGTIILLPKQNVIIIPSYSTINGVRVLSKFTVQTPEGLVYTFGKSTGECVDFHYLTNYVMPNQYAYPETNSNRRRFGKAGVLESELPFRGMLLCFPRALKYGSTYETAYTVMNSPSYAAKWNLVQVKSLVSNEIVNLNYSTQPVELVYNVQKNWQHDFPDFASNGAELECAPHDPDIIALTGQPLSQWQAGTANLSLTISEKHERNYLLQSINGQNGDKLEFIYEKSAPEVVNKAFCSAIHYKIDDHFSKGWAFIYDDVIQPLQFDCNVESSNSVTTYSATNEMVYNLGEVVAKPIYSVLSYTYLLLPTGKFQQFYLPHGGPIWDQRWHNGKQLREFGSLVKIKRYSNTLDWEKEKVQFQGESSRTFLKSIQEIDRDMGMHPVLTVDYTKKDELPSLPKRFSVNQDLWGYYNDNSLSKSLLPKIIYEGYDGQWISAPNPAVMNHYGFSTDGDVALGHNINTSAERCVIGSLNKLLLETGGIYEFKYESIKMPGNVYGGGFRVKSLIKNPNAGPQQVRMYEYANAKPANYPIRSFKNIYNFDSHSKQRYISTSSVPQNDWLLNKNHFIGYENVKVNYIGNGFIKFRFSPIEVGIIREVGYLNDVVRRTTTAVSTYALSLPIPYEYDDFDLGIINPSEVGQLLESTSFGEDGIMESKSSYTYELFNSVNNDDIHSLQLMTNITRYPGIFADNKGIGEVFNAITTYAAAYSDVLKYFLMAFEVVTGTRKIHQYSKFRYLSYNRFISNSLLASETSSRYYPSGSSGYTKTYSYQQAGPYLLSVKDQTTYTDGSTVVNKVYFPQTADSDFLKLNGSDHSLLLTAKIALALKTESFLNGENDAHRTSGSINVLTYANSRFVTSDLWESLCGIWRLKARFSNFTDGLPQKYQIAKFGDGGLASPDGFSFFEDIDLTWSHRMLMQKRLYGSSIVQDFLYTPYRELELTNDRNGVVSDYEYDNRGRLYKAIKNNGRQTTTYEYSFQPNVFSSTASFQDGTTEQKISEEFDGFAHLLKKIRNGSSVLELNTYDEMFRPIQTKAIGSGPILNTYSKSPAGDLLKTVDAVGNKTEFAYKGNNVDGFQSTSIKDANDHISIKSVDALGRVTKTSSAEGGQTVYGYDALGRLGSVGNPIQENYLFHYNDMGKLTSKLVPSSNPENSWYDERFRLAATSDANGHQFIYLYDELDRLNDIYQMDPPVLLPNTGLINASDAQQLSGSGIRMQHIDYVTNKTWVRQTFDRVLGESIGEEFKQMELGTWDDLGRGTELTYTYPDGIIKETIGYNDANLIVLDRKLFEGSLLNGFESKYNYTFSEHLLPHKTYLTTNVFHQFLLSEEIYNLEDQLTVKKLSGLAGTVLQNIDYGYDAAGRLVRINEPMSTACMKDVEYCTLDLNYSITAGCNIVKGINLGLSDVIFPTIVTLPSDVQLLQEYIDQALYDQGLYGHSVVKLENPGQGEPQNLLVWIYETNASSAYLIFPTNHICPELWRFNSSNCCTFQSGPIEADPPIGHPMTAGKPTP